MIRPIHQIRPITTHPMTELPRSERTTLSSAAQLLAFPHAASIPAQTAWITRPLADSLAINTGDVLLITLPSANGTSDALLAHRDRTTLASLRVTITRILDDRSVLGEGR